MQMITPICKLVPIIRLFVNLAGKIFQKQLKVMKLHPYGGEVFFFFTLSLEWSLFDFDRNLPRDVITPHVAFLSVALSSIASGEQHSILFASPLS